MVEEVRPQLQGSRRQKYADQKSAAEVLAKKPQVSAAEARALATYVLSLK